MPRARKPRLRPKLALNLTRVRQALHQASLDTKTKSKYLDETEAKYEVKKAILAASLRHYTESEARLVSNMNKNYGIIWGNVLRGCIQF